MQIYSKSMKNATSLFRNHNRSNLEAGTYITHRVIYYPLVLLFIYIWHILGVPRFHRKLLKHKFHHHLPIQASKVQIWWKTLAQMAFLLAPKRKRVTFCIESRMSTRHFQLARFGQLFFRGLSKCLPESWLLLAPGNQASAYKCSTLIQSLQNHTK